MLPAEEPPDPDRLTLLRLHELVPAAEELDLAEEAHREQLAAGFGLADRDDRETGAPEAAGPCEVVRQEEDPLTDGQVRGLLEHQLGATSLPDPQDDATDADARDPDHERDD